MTTAVSFTVLGAAAAKGNMKAFPFKRRDGSLGAATTEGTKGSKAWQDVVAAAAQQQCHGVFFEGPVRLGVVFFLPHPVSEKKRRAFHTVKPDLDKLLRAIKDALKNILWKDDAQVIELLARKGYAVGQPYVRIVVDHAAPVDDVAVQDDLLAPLRQFTEDTHAPRF